VANKASNSSSRTGLSAFGMEHASVFNKSSIRTKLQGKPVPR
jgi:hypothetical protein